MRPQSSSRVRGQTRKWAANKSGKARPARRAPFALRRWPRKRSGSSEWLETHPTHFRPARQLSRPRENIVAIALSIQAINGDYTAQGSCLSSHECRSLVPCENAINFLWQEMWLDGLPAEGLEPTRSCDHWILSPARLPIPPRRRLGTGAKGYEIRAQAQHSRAG